MRTNPYAVSPFVVGVIVGALLPLALVGLLVLGVF